MSLCFPLIEGFLSLDCLFSLYVCPLLVRGDHRWNYFRHLRPCSVEVVFRGLVELTPQGLGETTPLTQSPQNHVGSNPYNPLDSKRHLVDRV
jgi:hypothetical protein